MRILHVTSKPYASTYGGLEIYLQYLLPAQVREGNEVWIASILFNDNESELKWVEIPPKNGVHIVEIHLPERFQFVPEDDYELPLEECLKVILNQIKPDICHCHHGFAVQTIRVCQNIGIKTVYTIHCSEIFCLNGMLLKHGLLPCDGICSESKCLSCCGDFLPYPMLWRCLLAIFPKSIRKWIECRIHLLPFVYFLTPLFRQTRFLSDILKHQIILAHADAVIAPSHAVARLALRQTTSWENVHTILHGIPELESFPYPSVDSEKTVHFYYVGRICYYKGIHILLEAFSNLQHDNWRLHLIGEPVLGIERKYAINLKRKYTDNRIIWHGRIPHDELGQIISGYHVMVHPAMYFEIYGLTVAEAQALGKPVLATTCGGPESQIKDGENGWLVPRNNTEALKGCIDKILDNPETLVLFGSKCHYTVLSEHIRELSSLYNQLAMQASLGGA